MTIFLFLASISDALKNFLHPVKLRWQSIITFTITYFCDDLVKVLWNSSGMPQKLYGNWNFGLSSLLYYAIACDNCLYIYSD